MRVLVAGSGYAGITLSCLADKGHEVTVLDRDQSKVDSVNRGEPPIYEEGLGDILKRNVGNGRLSATTDYSKVREADVVFVCVGTPSNEDGSVDLSQVESCCRSVGEQLKAEEGYKVVVIKSTVPPGTTSNVVVPVLEEASGKSVGEGFGVCTNPEFLREGKAVHDSANPDKIVIGGADAKAQKVLDNLYSSFDQSIPRIFTDANTAEMIKYANNAMLATRVSFINEIANICERSGADVTDVARAIGMDRRIGPSFLDAGIGFGGSCFPKDLKALISAARGRGVETPLMDAVVKVNEYQPRRVTELAESAVGDLSGKTVSVLGLSFKPGTDDVRESRAVPAIRSLLEKGAKVKAYDPQATENARKVLGESVEFCPSAEECLSNSHLAVIATEWDSFKSLNPADIPVPVVDGRRALDPEKAAAAGIRYRGIGWKGNFGDA